MKSFAKYWFYMLGWNRAHDHFLLTPFEKRDRIKYFADRTGAETFVETGSFHGDTSKFLAGSVGRVITIEIDPANAAVAVENCAATPNVTVYCGPSEDVLPLALKGVSGNVLFWLDAHYQTSMTRGRSVCPLFTELETIFATPNINPTILIDDARKFLWINGWPSLTQVQRFVEARGYGFRVSHDMISVGKFSM